MNTLSRYLPWGVLAVAVLFLAYQIARPEKDSTSMDLQALAQLPVLDGGRVQPLDGVARRSLMLLRATQTFYDDDGVEHSAMKWLLDVMISPPGRGGPADKYKVFRIQNDEVLSLLGLQPRSRFRYALEEFFPRLEEFYKQARRAQQAQKADPDKKLDLYDTKLLETAGHFELYAQLASFLSPRTIPPSETNGHWQAYGQIEQKAKDIAVAKVQAAAAREGVNFKDLTDADMHKWAGLLAEEQAKALAKLTPPAGEALVKLVRAYEKNQPDEFNEAVAAYQEAVQHLAAAQAGRARFEAFFDHVAPFYICICFYVFVFLLVIVGWVTYMGPLHRAALWLALLAFVVHTAALIGRMYLNGRPPVTNLYSSAVFIGWGAVGLGLILERIYRLGLGTAVAAVAGALTLFIAHYLGLGNDTLEPMQAVLATNFWLATHVTCVTLGYVATFVAGFLGIAFIGLGVFTPWLDRDLFKTLGRMIYGVVCFATLLSFVGTVLGGIWADQSWGRFWGWDTKENGALLIVLANALILHARWGGMIQQRGMAVLAVFGNIVTSWSWFGVNMLGVGLHSYGFIPAAVFVMVAWVVLNLAIIGVGLLPFRMWQSFLPRKPQPPTDRPTQPGPRARARSRKSTAITTTG
jgi:ABC-type transport system involved in cytochrome c biogenesis permease subunit